MGDLEQQLARLGADISLPDPPDLTAAILADPRMRRVSPPVRFRRRVGVAVLAVLIVVVAIPAPRRAIASLLGLGGTEITFVDELPPAAAEGVIPGERVSLSQARALVPFGILLPDAEPDELFVDRAGPSQILTMVFDVGESTYGLVITEMSADVDAGLLQKSVLPDGEIVAVTVGGDPGFWIEGAHALSFLDDQGRPHEVGPRLVASTLLFVRRGVTVRLESAFELEAALELAATLAER